MDRRKRARFTLNDPLDSSVRTAFNAKMLDLSSDGALLESARPLSIGTACEIRVQYDEGDFLLYAAVRNCRIDGSRAGDAKERTTAYLVGLQFNEKGRHAVNELLSRVPAYVKKSGGTEEERAAMAGQKGPAEDQWRSGLEISVSVRIGESDTLEPHMLENPSDGADLPKPGEREVLQRVFRLEQTS